MFVVDANSTALDVRELPPLMLLNHSKHFDKTVSEIVQHVVIQNHAIFAVSRMESIHTCNGLQVSGRHWLTTLFLVHEDVCIRRSFGGIGLTQLASGEKKFGNGRYSCSL